MKHLLLSLLLTSFISFVFAANVELQDAKSIAKNAYYQKLNTHLEKVDFDAIEIVDYYVINQNGESVIYAFNFKNYGFILIAADNAIEPVLGYAFDNHYTTGDQSQGFKGVLWEYGIHITHLRTNKVEASPAISQQWNELADFNPTAFAPNEKSKDIEPLLTCTWDQGHPYNYYCPPDAAGPAGKVLVGCVATAMAQIMQYWRYPDEGSGSSTYYCYPYGTLTANYGQADYDWNEAVDNPGSTINHTIALISYHAGIAVEMEYSPDASGAYSSDVPNAMRNYFNYANNVQYLQRTNYPLTSWETYLQLELEDNCPVYYSGQSPDGGHAFVLDGYHESDGLYHFNFGWGGSGNGWFLVTNAGGFTTQQGMIKNIEPNDPGYPYGCDPDFEFTKLVGVLEDGSGPQEDYDANVNCSWLINPQTETDSVTKVVLSFVWMDTDENDIITVYDGASTSDPILGEYSGSDAPTGSIYSTDNALLITFEGNGDGTTGTGFKIEYSSYLPSYCSGFTELTETSGSFEDGSGDFHYRNATNCSWSIAPEWASDITLSFTEFHTEEDADILSVLDPSNMEVLATFSGDYSSGNLPDPVYCENGALFIKWETNQINNAPGWTVEWEIGNTGVEAKNIEFNSLLVYPNPTNNLLNVSFELENSQDFEMRIISVTGNVVYQESKDSFSGHYVNTIDLSDMAKGVYFLNLSNETGSINKKVVIK